MVDRNHIWNMLSLYSYRDVALADVTNVLQQYPNLKPHYEAASANGQYLQMFCLDGTIPVPFQGRTYNIPVKLVLPTNYPQAPPVCHVVPTPTMRVNVSTNVDDTGRILIPFLRYWQNYPHKDLLELIRQMILVFSQMSPVVSVPAGATMPPPAVHHSHSHSHHQPPTSATMPQPTPQNIYPYQPTPVVGGYHTDYAKPPQQPDPSGNGGSANIQQSIDEVTRNSLISAVNERLVRKKRDLDDEKMQLQRFHKTLLEGQKNLEGNMEQLESELQKTEKNITLLTTKNEEMKVVLQQLSQIREINTDDIIVPITPKQNQLYDVISYDLAVEDAIYFLGKTLKQGKIDLNSFLKSVRQLAREQFLKRALALKLQEELGSAPIAS